MLELLISAPSGKKEYCGFYVDDKQVYHRIEQPNSHLITIDLDLQSNIADSEVETTVDNLEYLFDSKGDTTSNYAYPSREDLGSSMIEL